MKYRLMKDKGQYLKTSDILDDRGWARTQACEIPDAWYQFGIPLRSWKGEPGFMSRTSKLELEDKTLPFKVFYPIRVLEGLGL